MKILFFVAFLDFVFVGCVTTPSPEQSTASSEGSEVRSEGSTIKCLGYTDFFDGKRFRYETIIANPHPEKTKSEDSDGPVYIQIVKVEETNESSIGAETKIIDAEKSYWRKNGEDYLLQFKGGKVSSIPFALNVLDSTPLAFGASLTLDEDRVLPVDCFSRQ